MPGLCHLRDLRRRRLARMLTSLAAGLLVAVSIRPAIAAPDSINGYASDESVVQGGSLDLHVSTSGATYDIVIEDALEPGTVLATLANLPGQDFATPDSAFAWGCGWPVAASVP